MNRNSDWDFFLACVGIAVGFSQNAFSVVANVYNSKPVEGWDAIACGLFVLAFGVGIKSYFSWKRGKSDLRAALDQVTAALEIAKTRHYCDPHPHSRQGVDHERTGEDLD